MTFKEYKEGTDLLKKWADAYYGKDDPLTSDYDYDILYHKLLDYEYDNPENVIHNSPTQVVGYTYETHGK